MKKISKILLSLFLSFAVLFSSLNGFGELKQVKASENGDYIHPKLRGKFPLYGGYYRTWHDVTSIGIDGQSNGGQVKMDEVPEGTDIMFIFDDWQHEESPFYETLKNTYVPNLHAKGTLVVRTIGTEFLMGRTGIAKGRLDYYTNDQIGYERLAKDLVKTYVTDFGIDGLDIDVEAHNYSRLIISEEEQQRIHGVFQELGKLIGRNGKNSDLLFIYDTTLGVEPQVFKENYKNFDLVLVQAYGKATERGVFDNYLQKVTGSIDYQWNEFKQYIHPLQFMIGFSFYEENGSLEGGRWYDVPLRDNSAEANTQQSQFTPNSGIEGSRAGRYALWQPQGGVKGGLFSYAIERDGVFHPTKEEALAFSRYGTKTDADQKLPTTFEHSKKLIEMMNNSQDYQLIDSSDFPDEALLNEIRNKVGTFRGDLKLFDGDLVIENPEIRDIRGLEKLIKLRSLELKNLHNLEIISKENLPTSIFVESLAPNKRQQSRLKLEGLTNLKKINLSHSNFEHLNFVDVENWTKLENVDISENLLDFSENSNEKNILDSLISTVEKNTHSQSNIQYGNQTPKAYFNILSGNEVINLEGQKGEIFDVRSKLAGFTLYSGAKVEDEEKFNEILSNNFIDNSYTFDQFKENVNTDSFRIEIKNSRLENIDQSTISDDVEETYTIKYFDSSEKLVHTLVLNIGAGRDVLDVVSENPTKVYGMDGEEIIKRAFDGKLTSRTNENAFMAWNAGGWFVFEIDPKYQVEYFKLFQKTNNPMHKDNRNNIETGRLEYLENNDLVVEGYSNREIHNFFDTQDWKVAVEMDTRGNVKDQGPIFSRPINSISARYWRFKFDTTVEGGVSYAFPQIEEIQLLGKEKPASEFNVRLNAGGGTILQEYENTVVPRGENFELEPTFVTKLVKPGYSLKGYEVVSGTLLNANGEQVTEISKFKQSLTPKTDVEIRAIWEKTKGQVRVELFDENPDAQKEKYTLALEGADGQTFELNSTSYHMTSRTWVVDDVPNGEYTLSIQGLDGNLAVEKVGGSYDNSSVISTTPIKLNINFEDEKSTAFTRFAIQEKQNNINIEVRDTEGVRTDILGIKITNKSGKEFAGSYNDYKQYKTNLSQYSISDKSVLSQGIYKVEFTNIPENNKLVLNEDVPSQVGAKSDLENVFEINVQGDENSFWLAVKLEKIVDKTELEEFVKLIENSIEEIIAQKTEDSVLNLQEFLQIAKEVLQDPSTNQEEVNLSLQNLRTAFEGLEAKLEQVVNKDLLISILEIVKNKDLDRYTEESKNNLLDSINKAEEILENQDVLQEDVDNAITDLVQKLANLIEDKNDEDIVDKIVDEDNSETDESLSLVIEKTSKKLDEIHNLLKSNISKEIGENFKYQTFDIYVKNSNGERVKETTNPMNIKLNTDVLGFDLDEISRVVVFNNHEGELLLISNVDINYEDKFIEFNSTKFSDYVIVAETPSTNTSTNNDDSIIPDNKPEILDNQSKTEENEIVSKDQDNQMTESEKTLETDISKDSKKDNIEKKEVVITNSITNPKTRDNGIMVHIVALVLSALSLIITRKKFNI